MLHAVKKGRGTAGDTALVLMHFLGGSAREWDEVVSLFGDGIRTVAVDLPGFGGSASVPGYTVEQMADSVEYLLGTLNLGRYVLVGHSMSGKVAAVLARRFADRKLTAASDAHGVTHGTIHTEQLNGFAGLVLVAPSPPQPEPMAEDKRAQMLANLGETKEGDRKRARAYITKQEERDIPELVLERAVGEVLKMSRPAWVAWLEHGSKEDWADRVGILELPAMIVAGEKDRSLGADQQRATTLRHLPHAELKIVPGCSHLIPMERPQEMAALLRGFLAGLDQTSALPANYRTLIDSERVSPRTREVLEQRLAGPAVTDILNPSQLQTLRAVCRRLIPQSAGHEIDLAATIAARLATGRGDGWRYAVLAEDSEAYRGGLDSLATQGFNSMTNLEQDQAIQALGATAGSADARWFEELRGDATTAYMAHPTTFARIGYSGIGVGGANTPHQGFTLIEIGEVEPWEPKPVPQEQEA